MIPNVEPSTRTERFDIFAVNVLRDEDIGMPRLLYTAWYHSEDVPRPVCEIVVGLMGYVEWVHVCETHRRKGIAMEVFRAVDLLHKEKLIYDEATEAGDRFIEAYDARYPKVVQP